MRAQKWAFLVRGSNPPGLDEDDPAVTAMEIAAADKIDGTYKISDR
jgi:hypothetical protein